MYVVLALASFSITRAVCVLVLLDIAAQVTLLATVLHLLLSVDRSCHFSFSPEFRCVAAAMARAAVFCLLLMLAVLAAAKPPKPSEDKCVQKPCYQKGHLDSLGAGERRELLFSVGGVDSGDTFLLTISNFTCTPPFQRCLFRMLTVRSGANTTGFACDPRVWFAGIEANDYDAFMSGTINVRLLWLLFRCSLLTVDTCSRNRTCSSVPRSRASTTRPAATSTRCGSWRSTPLLTTTLRLIGACADRAPRARAHACLRI